MESRWLAVDSLAEAFAIDADTLQRRFDRYAPELAADAGRLALQRATLGPADIGAVVVTTCTGYLCPGLTSYVNERLGLSRHVKGFDLVGQGCAGALPNWQLASALLDAGHCDHVLSICVEVCSAAMYLDDDPGVLISACLFGDGAGAAILSRNAPSHRRRVRWATSVSVTVPADREALRFEHRSGLLRNVLTRAVPGLAAARAEEALRLATAQTGVTRDSITGWMMHAGGRDVLLAMQEQLRLDPTELRYSRDALREYGNLSSAFVYFVLDAALADSAPGGWWWLCSFGAGFTCHGALLAVD
ncbi:MAG: 3-oxoacyl-[acyl-carrier-protein] synthase III C-terminal domain-containing protein [Steroidobacteraceae bacterium]